MPPFNNPYQPYQPYQPNPYGQPTYGFQQPPYQPQIQQPQPQVQKPLFDFVNGVEGAKSYRLLPNQSAILLDNDNSLMYIKTANALGQSAIEYYSIQKTTEEMLRGTPKQEVSFVSREDFDELVKKVTLLERAVRPQQDKSNE